MAQSTKVVLYWPESNEVSIEDLALVYEEDRFVGAPTAIKLKGNKKTHKAIVRLISRDASKLDEKEDEIIKEIDEKLKTQNKEPLSKKFRQTRMRRKQPSDSASNNQVSAAVGERVKPNAAQKGEKKIIAEEKQAHRRAIESAQDDLDQEVVNAVVRFSPEEPSVVTSAHKKRRANAGINSPTSVKSSSSSDEDTDKRDEGDSDYLLMTASDKDNMCHDNEGSIEGNLNLELDDLKCDETSAGCVRCRPLVLAGRKSPLDFMKAATIFLSQEKHPLHVQLSKGFNVYLSAHDKNTLKIDGDGDPSKYVRLAIVKLFGREIFLKEDITALWSKPGSKGIRPEVRQAILSFANRNRCTKKYENPLKESQFTRILNRKKTQVKRTHDLKVSGQKRDICKCLSTKSTEKSEENAAKTPHSCLKVRTPTKQDTAVFASGEKKSPWKVSVSPSKVHGVAVNHPSSGSHASSTPGPQSGSSQRRLDFSSDHNNSGHQQTWQYGHPPAVQQQPFSPWNDIHGPPPQSSSMNYAAGYNQTSGSVAGPSGYQAGFNAGPFYGDRFNTNDSYSDLSDVFSRRAHAETQHDTTSQYHQL